MEVTPNVQTAYEQQYQGRQGRWRQVGAEQKALNILEVCGGLKPGRVLEVGAGEGSILACLNRTGFGTDLYAVEISGSALALIRAKNIPNLRQALAFDGYTIPFPDRHFDLVILSHVLEHVEYERTLLRELKRVARRCVIEVPKDYRPGVDANAAHFLAYGHINVYTPSSLRFLLRTEGFRIVAQKVGVYSRETYRMIYGRGWKAGLLHAFKKVMVSLPVPSLRDHFANTVTVLLESDDTDLAIF